MYMSYPPTIWTYYKNLNCSDGSNQIHHKHFLFKLSIKISKVDKFLCSVHLANYRDGAVDKTAIKSSLSIGLMKHAVRNLSKNFLRAK